jgi:16S rRNA G527 N7-methylase RsmG
MINSTIERSLLESLHAYVKRFDTPNSRADLLAIASSIQILQQKLGELISDYFFFPKMNCRDKHA